MRAKSLFTCVFIVVLSAPSFAAPSFVVKPRPYNAANGGLQWEVLVTQNDATYAGSLAVELPLVLGPHNGPAFPQFMHDALGDDTNGAASATWYYNETADGSGILIWNTSDPPDASNHNQDTGANPFTGTTTEGLQIDAANKRLFASLGSTVALPADALANGNNPLAVGKQVRLLRVLTSDGIFNWTNAIVGENHVQYPGITGLTNSIIPGDMNASGDFNPGTGAFTDPTTFADIPDYQLILTGAAGVAAYNAAHPGLNGAKRGDFNGNGTTNFGDIPGFQAALASPTFGAGSGLGDGGSVPEPSSLLLLVLGGSAACAMVRRRTIQTTN